MAFNPDGLNTTTSVSRSGKTTAIHTYKNMGDSTDDMLEDDYFNDAAIYRVLTDDTLIVTGSDGNAVFHVVSSTIVNGKGDVEVDNDLNVAGGHETKTTNGNLSVTKLLTEIKPTGDLILTLPDGERKSDQKIIGMTDGTGSAVLGITTRVATTPASVTFNRIGEFIVLVWTSEGWALTSEVGLDDAEVEVINDGVSAIISLEVEFTEFTTTGATDFTATLNNGLYAGQRKILSYIDRANAATDGTVTVDNYVSGASKVITFDDVGDTIHLIWTDNGYWGPISAPFGITSPA